MYMYVVDAMSDVMRGSRIRAPVKEERKETSERVATSVMAMMPSVPAGRASNDGRHGRREGWLEGMDGIPRCAEWCSTVQKRCREW